MQRINRVFDVLEIASEISQEGAYSLKDFLRSFRKRLYINVVLKITII